MAEKRHYRRVKRRLKVLYGEQDFSKLGFTVDLSRGGIFIASTHIPPLNTRLHLQIFVNPDAPVYMEGMVRRLRTVPPQLRSVQLAGFGVRFLSPEEVLAEVLSGAQPLQVRFATQADLQRALSSEIRAGGLFVPTSHLLARDSETSVEIFLEFAQTALEFSATVIHAMQGPSVPQGMAVVFKNKNEVLEALKPFIKED